MEITLTPGSPETSDPSSWTEVIGVVRDTGTGDFGDDVLDAIPQLCYRSYTQSGALPTTVITRTSRDRRVCGREALA